MISNDKIKSWIPKKLFSLIMVVEQDSVDGGTIWVFGKDNYEHGEYTQKKVKDGLRYWLDQIEANEVEA